jgi:superfamily II DNA or RNA helicase
VSAIEFRSEIVQRLKVDLVGPHEETERLENKPSDVYLTGILWPIDSRITGEAEDGDVGESEDDIGFKPTIVGQQRPAAMGVTFRTKSSISNVNVNITFATYERNNDDQVVWQRSQHEICINVSLEDDENLSFSNDDSEYNISVHHKCHQVAGGRISTITLVNRREMSEDSKSLDDEFALFQAQMEFKLEGAEVFSPRFEINTYSSDPDEQSAQLLYREKSDFAVGHQCSAGWSSTGDHIWSTWLPSSIVEAYSDSGSEVFKELNANGVLSAEILGLATESEVLETMTLVADAYREWINKLEAEIQQIDPRFTSIAQRHRSQCLEVESRIRKGIEYLDKTPIALRAFRLANLAMHLQHSWKLNSDGKALPPLVWKPFQIGFILLAVESVCNRASSEREVFDLLWFPTGGGKTEAYLALIAISAWFRRLTNPTGGASVVAVMRYTLRLLTAQQFERAVGMLLACELLRQGKAYSQVQVPTSAANFSAGLWVGADATPNDYLSAQKLRKGSSSQTAEQIEKCFVCHEGLLWDYDDKAELVRPYCASTACALGKAFGKWPVYTVDSNIYEMKPTLLVGTIDKFAQVPFKKETAELFAFRTSNAPDLIIQDELHLISGPLGTIAGLYETAFDWLMAFNGRRVKIIGSTATIRRAEAQARALFNRSSVQFPPPGLTYRDSGFAVVDAKKPGRLYVGVSTAGRSAKFTSQAAAGSVMQSVGGTSVFSPESKDGYWTLLYYFNSLRELGGAIVQVLDDVPDSMQAFGGWRGEEVRELTPPDELTSRVSQREIVEILTKLSVPHWQEGASDIVLATNMVSVGVDVARLGLMVMMGQPKARSEYIQATSRVGRSSHPGLVISLFNVAKTRDRSHFETFAGWHGSIYKDVEATSVTPFSPRSRERALRAVLVSMLRYSRGSAVIANEPKLLSLPDALINEVIQEIQSRAMQIDPIEGAFVRAEIAEALDDWDFRKPEKYENRKNPNTALLERAEDAVRRVAAGKTSNSSWPLLNSMRSVEAATLFRMAEVFVDKQDPTTGGDKPWRSKRNEE